MAKPCWYRCAAHDPPLPARKVKQRTIGKIGESVVLGQELIRLDLTGAADG